MSIGVMRKNIDIVADLVRNFLSLTVPISVEGLCDAVNEKLPGQCSPTKDLRVDAEIKTNAGTDQFVIRYLPDKPETRILFSIAHELGHLFLHLLDDNGKIMFNEGFQRNMEKTEQELEANEFAAAFLMPDDRFVEVCRKNLKGQKVNVTKVADAFNVSVQAATVRGNVLGLW